MDLDEATRLDVRWGRSGKKSFVKNHVTDRGTGPLQKDSRDKGGSYSRVKERRKGLFPGIETGSKAAIVQGKSF